MPFSLLQTDNPVVDTSSIIENKLHTKKYWEHKMLDEQKQQLIQSSKLLIPNRGDRKAIKQLASDGGSESSLDLSLTSVTSADSLTIGKCMTAMQLANLAILLFFAKHSLEIIFRHI